MFEIVNWIDSETLLLIFSMMVLVAILMETGVFEYVAVCAFQVKQIISSFLKKQFLTGIVLSVLF